MKYRALLPDHFLDDIEADNEEDAQKKAMQKFIEELEPGYFLVWEDKSPPVGKPAAREET